MAGSGWAIAVSVTRKAILALAIVFASVEAHIRWGYEYTGPGMHQVSLLVTVTAFAMVCSALFLLCSGIAAWALRQRSWPTHWIADTVLFFAWGGFTVWAAVTAKIVD